MRIAVLKESTPGELRVGQVPDTVAKLVKAGVEVALERGAGLASGYDDAAYGQVRLADSALEAVAGAAVVVSVRPPPEAVVRALARGTVLISMLPSAQRPLLAELGLDAFALERVPRTTRGQAVDVLSSQATVAGYKAVLLGSGRLLRLLPMLTTAAGTLTPAKVLVLGAGVAGLQAIATAHRLGAQVSGFDVRAAVKEQVQSLGAKFVEIDGVSAEGTGGYAKEVGQDEQARIVATLSKVVPAADLVITTAQIPNRPAPRLVTRAMVEAMKRGSVIVDLAAESGGNCELTRAGEEVLTPGGVLVLGPVNLAATMPFHASSMFAKNVLTLLQLIIKQDAVTLDLSDELVAAMLVTHQGQLRHA